MSNFYLSPNMSLVIPYVSVDPGPDWATNLNASLTLLDMHDHTPGKGVQITPSGININADLSFNLSNNATQLRSVRFVAQASPLALTTDLGCLYESGVDLYYNDGAGNQIRMTQSGSVAGASGTITGLPSGTASAAYSAPSGTFIFQQATSTAANIDIGSIILRYPGSYPSPSGNYILIEAPATLATGYAMVLPGNVPGANGAFLVESTAGVVSYVNVDNSTVEINAATLRVKAGGITGTQIQTSVNLNGLPKAQSRNLVVSHANFPTAQAIINGAVNAAGTAVYGYGFTSSYAGTPTDIYTVTFTNSMADVPTVFLQVNSAGNNTIIGLVVGVGPNNFTCSFFNTVTGGQALVPCAFNFIAIGPAAT